MKKLILAVILAALPFSLATADLKVALIDVNKVANAYYKAKEVADKFKQKQDADTKVLRAGMADYERTGHECEALDKAAKDPTLSEQARADKTKALEAKEQDLLALKNRLTTLQGEQQREQQDQMIRFNREIFDEIDKVADDYANAQGYDLVLQRTLPGGVAMILHSSSKVTDISDAIIAQINKNAPAAGAAPSGAASSAPAPSAAPAPKQ